MITSQTTRLFDENSVFKKLFEDKPVSRPPTKAERMDKIFANAKTTESNIHVSDFLPSY